MNRQRPIERASLFVALVIITMAGSASAQDSGFSLRLSGEVSLGAPESAPPPAAEAPSELEVQLQRLQSEDPETRLDAVRALGGLGDPAAVEPLIAVAESDPRPELRGWALRALHHIGTPEALAALQRSAENDADERVRGLAAGLVGPQETEAVEPEPAPVELPEPVEPSQTAEPPVFTPPPAVEQPFAVEQDVDITINTTPVDAPEQYVLIPQETTPNRAELIELRRVRRAGLGLRISGWILFGITYGTAFMAGTAIVQEDADDGWPLMVPLIGPAITGFRILGEDSGATPAGILSLLWSVAEIAGFSMAISGHVRRNRARRVYRAQQQQRAQRQVAILPSGPGDGPGVSLAATF